MKKLKRPVAELILQNEWCWDFIQTAGQVRAKMKFEKQVSKAFAKKAFLELAVDIIRVELKVGY